MKASQDKIEDLQTKLNDACGDLDKLDSKKVTTEDLEKMLAELDLIQAELANEIKGLNDLEKECQDLHQNARDLEE